MTHAQSLWWQLDVAGRITPFARERFQPIDTPSPYLWIDPAQRDWEHLPDEALAHLAAIAVAFAKPTDGRGFSVATVLRRRGWHGPLIAAGYFLLDQLDLLRRCGFDAFAPDPARFDRAALERDGRRLLRVYSHPYQACAAEPLPLWRRVQRSVPAADSETARRSSESSTRNLRAQGG